MKWLIVIGDQWVTGPSREEAEWTFRNRTGQRIGDRTIWLIDKRAVFRDGAIRTPPGGRLPILMENRRRYCGARNRRGKPCMRPPLSGRLRCRLHGGVSEKARDDMIETGKYSKYLPTHLAERYSEAMVDPDLLSAAADVALLHARITELIERVGTGESAEAWKDLAEVWAEFLVASEAGDTAAAQGCLNRIGRLIRGGAKRDAAWREIQDVVGQKVSIANLEHKRQRDLERLVPVESVMLLVRCVMAVVNEEVTDPVVRARVAARIITVLGPGNGSVHGKIGGTAAGPEGHVLKVDELKDGE